MAAVVAFQLFVWGAHGLGTTVFKFNEGGWPCTRIPSIILAGNSTLLAFAECRDRTGDGFVPAKPAKTTKSACVCMKRSIDGGMNWSGSAPRCVAPDGSDQPLAVHHRESGTTILHFNLNSTVHQVTSKDAGLHWSAAVSLGSALGKLCGSSNAGPGRGVEGIG